MLRGLLSNVLGDTQRKELEHFLEGLRGADSDDIGLIVACATDWRHRLAVGGCDLRFPAVCLLSDSTITFKLVKQIQALQKQGLPHLAVGLMVWVHSLRAMTRPELRRLGREMWKELSRGFDCAEEKAIGAASLIGVKYRTDDCDCIPDGLTPEPK